MDIDSLKEIVCLIDRTDIAYFKLENKEMNLKIKKKIKSIKDNNEVACTVDNKLKKIHINSKFVGTVHLIDYENGNYYAMINQEVNIGDTLCIIKILNISIEIKSEYNGRISKIYVCDNEVVDYGRQLLDIEVV